MTKPPVARKLAAGHCPTASFLATWFQVLIISKCMHAWSISMLLLLHSAFMLSVVKIMLKGEVGGRALNSHRVILLIMENLGKIMELCF